jgi:hypothetical protein
LFFAATWRGEDAGKVERELTYDYLKEYHNSPQNSSSDIYWIEASFIETLRSQEFRKQA